MKAHQSVWVAVALGLLATAVVAHAEDRKMFELNDGTHVVGTVLDEGSTGYLVQKANGDTVMVKYSDVRAVQALNSPITSASGGTTEIQRAEPDWASLDGRTEFAAGGNATFCNGCLVVDIGDAYKEQDEFVPQMWSDYAGLKSAYGWCPIACDHIVKVVSAIGAIKINYDTGLPEVLQTNWTQPKTCFISVEDGFGITRTASNIRDYIIAYCDE